MFVNDKLERTEEKLSWPIPRYICQEGLRKFRKILSDKNRSSGWESKPENSGTRSRRGYWLLRCIDFIHSPTQSCRWHRTVCDKSNLKLCG